jgi:CheY-like chemotaxis protein
VVLVADDDPDFRQLLRGLLTGLAGRVIEAADGEAALAALMAGPVELALVDLRMPGLDGYALLERLPAGIPAIVITSGDPGELPTRASGLLRKDQLTADRLRYAINRIKGAGDE